MAWTDLTFASESILTSEKMTQLQANFAAMAAGDSGAPEITPAAMQQSGTYDLGTADIETTGNITPAGVYLGGTAAANLLDDYEEGDFTPVWEDLSANECTMSTAHGTYIKIGQFCFFSLRAVVSSLGSATGEMVLDNLPFNNSSVASEYGTAHVAFAGGLAITAGVCVQGYVEISVNYIVLRVWDSTTGVNGTSLTHTQLSADGDVIVNGCYKTA